MFILSTLQIFLYYDNDNDNDNDNNNNYNHNDNNKYTTKINNVTNNSKHKLISVNIMTLTLINLLWKKGILQNNLK